MSFYLLLFFEFFKTGLFAIGGGLATLPFLYDMADKYTWLDARILPDMIAISQSVPGPIGVNMTTFAGYHAGGVPGAVIAALALVTPSVIIIVIVARFLNKFKDNFYVESVFCGLRPVACALISSASLQIFQVTLINIDRFKLTGMLMSLFDWKIILFFGLLVFLMHRFNKNPILYIIGAAAVGIVLKF